MRALLLSILLVAGCVSAAPMPSSPADSPPDELRLAGCAVHQALVQVAMEDAEALVPAPYVVAAYPAAAPGAPGAPVSARMDAPFVVCARAGERTGFAFFGAGIAIEPPSGASAANVTDYFGLGWVADAPEVADMLRAWGMANVEVGTTTIAETRVELLVTSRSLSESPVGRAQLDDRLAPAKPLARPAEVSRIHAASGSAVDFLIQPHDAVIGDGALSVSGASAWLAALPRAQGATLSAHAADPAWNVTLAPAPRAKA